MSQGRGSPPSDAAFTTLVVRDILAVNGRLTAIEAEIGNLFVGNTASFSHADFSGSLSLAGDLISSGSIQSQSLRTGSASIDDLTVNGSVQFSSVGASAGTIDTLSSDTATIDNATITNLVVIGTVQLPSPVQFDDSSVSGSLSVTGQTTATGGLVTDVLVLGSGASVLEIQQSGQLVEAEGASSITLPPAFPAGQSLHIVQTADSASGNLAISTVEGNAIIGSAITSVPVIVTYPPGTTLITAPNQVGFVGIDIMSDGTNWVVTGLARGLV
jgi:hypothetical protein